MSRASDGAMAFGMTTVPCPMTAPDDLVGPATPCRADHGAPSPVRRRRPDLAAVIGLAVVATVLTISAVPTRADDALTPADGRTELRLPGDPALEDEADDAEAAPTPGQDADAPVVADGPLRPKGALPEVPPAPEPKQDTWRRSFEGGLRWSKGDTSVTVSGAPGSVHLGGSITR